MRHNKRVQVLSLVERGWQAARQCSLEAADQGAGTLHLIKGRLPSDVRALIPAHERIILDDCPKQLFWPLVYAYSLGGIFGGHLRAILVDNERSLGRMETWTAFICRFAFRKAAAKPIVALVSADPTGYLLHTAQVPLSRNSWYHALGISG